MSKAESLAIGQVGACAFPSFTGVGEQNNRKVFSRTLFVEPPEFDMGDGSIGVCHYTTSLNQSTREGYLKARQPIIELDIYHPEKLTIPLLKETLGFLVLENVVNDPFYDREKDIFAMFILLKQIIATRGLVLFTDTFPNDQVLSIPYYDRITAFASSFGFTVILDELSGLTINHTSMKHKQEFLIGLLEELGILDPAFEKGIKRNCDYQYADWLILQKTLKNPMRAKTR